MAVVHCEYCDKQIDLDWNAEHFYDSEGTWDENNCEQKQIDEGQENKELNEQGR